jgi:hypothetical protein
MTTTQTLDPTTPEGRAYWQRRHDAELLAEQEEAAREELAARLHLPEITKLEYHRDYVRDVCGHTPCACDSAERE